MAEAALINGVDVGRLAETIEAINNDPEIANFRFRASNRWDSGGHSTTRIHDFYGAKQNVAHRKDFTIEADEPELLLGNDQGANPVEMILSALAGCMTTTLVYQAAARGITIHSIQTELEGELDLRGFLGISDQVRQGYKNVGITMRVDADADQKTLDELVLTAQNLSPVLDMLSNPVNVEMKGVLIGTTH